MQNQLKKLFYYWKKKKVIDNTVLGNNKVVLNCHENNIILIFNLSKNICNFLYAKYSVLFISFYFGQMWFEHDFMSHI